MYSTKHLSYPLAIAALAALYPYLAQAADGDLPEVQQQGNISYMSGGIGKEESNALEAVQRSYNLRIMSSDKTGHFSGDTRIIVSDLEHHTLLDITGGPLFYANLPDGHYGVEGFSAGQHQKKTFAIVNGKPARIHFSWQQGFNEAANY